MALNLCHECNGVDPTDGVDEEQYNIQSLSLDQATNTLYLCVLVICTVYYLATYP